MKNGESKVTQDGGIKAVEMVRRIRDEQYKILKDKSPEERRAFHRQKAQALHKKLGIKQVEKKSA